MVVVTNKAIEHLPKHGCNHVMKSAYIGSFEDNDHNYNFICYTVKSLSMISSGTEHSQPA